MSNTKKLKTFLFKLHSLSTNGGFTTHKSHPGKHRFKARNIENKLEYGTLSVFGFLTSFMRGAISLTHDKANILPIFKENLVKLTYYLIIIIDFIKYF